MGNLTRGFTIGAGAAVTNVATGFISKFLPATLTTGPVLLAVKAGVGLIALPMLLKVLPGGRRFASSVAIGAGVAIALDILNTYVIPNIPGISDYETGMLSDYETGMLSGYGDPTMNESATSAAGSSGVYSGGIYG
jgi:hypothetical protein